jgi:Uncharacterized protein conserved in bacteria (DUF2252)
VAALSGVAQDPQSQPPVRICLGSGWGRPARLVQAATEVFPGWIRIWRLGGVTRGRHVRRFHDWKGGADVGNPLPLGATLCARVCGATLARAHIHWGTGS